MKVRALANETGFREPALCKLCERELWYLGEITMCPECYNVVFHVKFDPQYRFTIRR